VDPVGPSVGSYRVHRGGCWHDPAEVCRPSRRFSFLPGFRNSDFGFRVVLVQSGDTE
jgi:formylglycine-generating enzyme required for sulfatase activity